MLRWLVEKFGGCWHEWSKWEEREATLRRAFPREEFVATVQKRNCMKCGLLQVARPTA